MGIERGHRTLHVIGKGNKPALIPLPVPVARTLDLAVADRVTGRCCGPGPGQRMDRNAATRVVARLAKRAGIAHRVGCHSLRHAYITAALDAGVPLRDVQIAARHADPRTTTRVRPGPRQPRPARQLHRRRLHRRRRLTPTPPLNRPF